MDQDAHSVVPESPYPIFVGRDLISRLANLVSLDEYSKIFVVTDKNVSGKWLASLTNSINSALSFVIVPSGEEAKSVKWVQNIWEQMLKFKCDRKSLLICLGGGVIGDLGGFAASTYMRGVDFLHIPTTLLSQVDSSIGGKVGINFSGVKNLIGTFAQPVAVVSDINTLATLGQREFVSGFAEIIKHGLIIDESYFKFVTSKKPKEFDGSELLLIVKKSIFIKSGIVLKDEKETGLRKILNFGHTIGHAIEAISHETDNPLLHGEAISIGMVAEAKISQLVGLIDEHIFNTIKESLQKAGLAIAHHVSYNAVVKKIEADKKNEKGEVNWTLLLRIGEAVTGQKVLPEIVKEAVEYINE